MTNETLVTKTVVFQRSEKDGGTLAVVHFHVTPSEDSPVKRLTAAMTAWVSGTPEGRQAWKASSEDFNIGDFSEAYGHSMYPYLTTQGILAVVFANISDDNAHENYDIVLVDRDEIEDILDENEEFEQARRTVEVTDPEADAIILAHENEI